jgi:hypothetical protein
MATAAVGGYEGGTGQIEQFRGADGELFVKLYNDTGAALTNGYIYKIDRTDDADLKGIYPTPAAIATDSVGLTEVVVVNNSPRGLPTIQDQEWGWFQKEGYCPKIISNVGGSGVTNEYYVKAMNGVATADDDGAAVTAKSFAIAKTASGAVSLAEFAGVLLGYRVTV